MANGHKMDLLHRIAVVAIGLFIVSVGGVLFIRAGLGVDPVTVLTQGVAKVLGVQIGTSKQILSLLTVAVVFVFDRRILGFGTVMDAVLVGLYINILLRLIPDAGAPIASWIMLALAIPLIGAGVAIYMTGDLGDGAIEAMMMLIHDRLGVEIRWARVGMDVASVAVGAALGGSVGIGTLLGAVLTGPVAQKAIQLLKRAHR
ncbi:MAG: hypothetical protein VB144_03475 [Clostridia bacterium]|nr:hypothetical protein [Clostridia bacterium]